MKNLSLISTSDIALPTANITATAFDLDENVLYVTSEKDNLDGEVEVELWKAGQSQTSDQADQQEIISTFTAVASSNGPSNVQVVSLRFLAEVRRICAIMRSGDITMVPVDLPSPPEVEGTFESGILAASWNPDESVVSIITGEQKLILLTSLFDVVSESAIHSEQFGEDAPINVGWGSKQTQFHGSLGKTAAQATPITNVGTSPDDDNLPRISWRGDGSSFVVSSVSPPTDQNPLTHRTLRVYDRQGVLQSTSENVPGLEHNLVWRPSGNLIVGTQRFGFEGGGAGREGRHDVVFFERNGLRHGEFSLRVDEIGVRGKELERGNSEKQWAYRVRDLSWNSDSSVLAIWIEGDDGDIVQFWSTGNYHWYLKHEVAAPATTEGQPSRFTSLTWHPEIALHLTLTTKCHVSQRMYSWDIWASPSQPPNDSGTVAVLDGSNILLTAFRSQNVPPPMSSYKLSTAPEPSFSAGSPLRVPIYASFSSVGDSLAVLWEDGCVGIWNLNTRLLPGPGKVLNPVQVWAGRFEGSNWRQLYLRCNDVAKGPYTLAALRSGLARDSVGVIEVQDTPTSGAMMCDLPYKGCRLLAGAVPDIYEGPDGTIFDYTEAQGIPTPVASFSEFCIQAHKASTPNSGEFYIGLAKSGKLYASKSDEELRILSSNATSFTIASGFVIFTTSTHEAVFVPLSTLPVVFEQPDEVAKDVRAGWSARKVERGSRIVVAVPSTMSLVLQMPRGNLETINPRPLVMEVVKQDLDAGNYRKAFFACRKHRIDLNEIVDHNQEQFMADIPSFVEQVNEIDHLNLFVTSIGRGSDPPEFISRLCDAFRVELEKKGLTRYINTILTTHVVKTPPDHEAGLALLLRLRDSDPEIVEDAVKYIIFLVDANSLFDTALGMYDFSLVIMIAQHAQKDPREYLPFLRELRALDKYYQRFKIDDHLKRYQGALKNLSLAGPGRFEEAVTYMEQHQLYEYGLAIWKGTEQYADILTSYGDWLFERREFRQAATVFIEAKQTGKAMIAYEKALEWQELFDLAMLDEMSEDDITELGYRVAEDLSSKKRYSEAGRVLLDYCKDIRETVIALVQGNAFSEARRIISLYSTPELIVDVVHPASLESRSQISEDLNEMREQLRKQRNRLGELRVKKVEQPDGFYGTEDNVALHDVDVMTDVSMPATAFTRYTVAPTTASRSSRRTSRSKRKMERKVGSGKKGTVDEEEYLLRSVTKLVERFTATRGETRSLLPHLFQFAEEHRQEGLDLQRQVVAFEKELTEALDEIWMLPAEDGEEPTPDGWAARMAELERKKAINPLEKVPKPDISQGKGWQVNLFQMI